MTTADAESHGAVVKPLTRSQLMIWTGQQLQPDDPLYNMALSFRVHGDLDPEAFRSAFQRVVDHCDALRTTFVTEADIPRQRILERYAYTVDMVDLSGCEDVEAAYRAWSRERATRRFDLAQCPYESTLIRLADDEYGWFLNQHHLITDAWSTALIYRTMQQYYGLAVARTLGNAEPLPSFASYVDYETGRQESKIMRNAREYWRARLATPAAASSFYRPTPRDRSGSTTRNGCDVGAERSAKIRSLAQSERFRELSGDLARFQVFATMLFAWLHRVTGNTVLTIGMPNHNRSLASHKQTVGLFIEVYPLRVEVAEQETFASLYAKVSRQTKELLINAPAGGSSFAHNRAYDVLLNYITATFGDFDGMPMDSEWVHADHGDRNHLLRMQVEDFDNLDRFRVYFDLNVDVFVGDEQTWPAQQFLRLLDGLLDDPDQPIAGVDLLGARERADLVLGFADAAPQAVPEETVYDMFLRQVGRQGDRVAIRCDEASLSYAQLLASVEALSTRLAARGLAKGARVAIALPRSIEAVVGILAVMRCGAAYVPVDPAYPTERIAFMLDDAAVSLVLTGPDWACSLPDGAESIAVEPATPDASVALDPGPAAHAGIDETAYVIYTSGSTGQPKGVDVCHRGLANYVSWAASYYLGGKALDWALFSSLSFDLTVTSIFVPLVTGGRIVVYPEPADRREITIRRVVEDDAVDIVKLTPAHLSLLQAMDLSSLRLRKFIVGGEDFKTDLARSVSSYFGGEVELYNEYGPTEATVACAVHRFDPDTDVGPSVPIGRAIDNAFVYVLNEAGRLQPRGVVGELCIGGAGVANGYLNRDTQTRERFVENPYRPGEMMYRTGDLARSNPDGTLTCLGRSDTQMKISGIRIEAGEVESALLAYPGIRESAVRLFEKAEADGASGDRYCVRCGLSDKHPDAVLDDDDVCRICHSYQAEREQALAYFGTQEDLQKIVAEARQRSDGGPDCMMLLSGGKDSTYALCQLVDLGLTPLVFTLDNGFISDGAKANMRRVVDRLGLELVTGSTPAMNDIFVDSLHRFSNVCNGCFKTIYTLSMKIARERGIRHIFTGLSRGQIFETRVADLFRQRIFEPARIDATIIEARKAYHRADDAVSKLLDVRHLKDESIFEEIQFVDYYRYSNVSLGEMLKYLAERVPWVRPADTGRSTNCLINEAGIHVHKQERGYHNYGLPYSWDVRLGHKERDAAMEELDDDINIDNVRRILGEIGYRPREAQLSETRRRFLAGYYVADQTIEPDTLKNWLARSLPQEFIPSQFVRLDELPLTPNGKLDRDALPEPELSRPQVFAAYAPPADQDERTLADIWAQVFGIDRVGVNDNFFDLGGDSIINIQIVSLAMKFGLQLSPQQVFDHPTIAELARVIDKADQVASEQGPVTGDVSLVPVQRRFFESGVSDPERATQYVILQGPARLDLLVLQEAVRQLLVHHDGLRSRFDHDLYGWGQTLTKPDTASIDVERFDLSETPIEGVEAAIIASADAFDRFDLKSGPLVRVAAFDRGGEESSLVLLQVHHLVVDAVSWWILVDDLDRAYRSLEGGSPVRLPPKTASVMHWSQTLAQYAQSDRAGESLAGWLEGSRNRSAGIPIDEGLDGRNDLTSAATYSIRLDADATRALTSDISARWRVQPQEVMIAALLSTLSKWSGAPNQTIDLEGHGREPISDHIDLLRTVGWFTSVYPVTFEYREGEQAGDTVRRVREKLRRISDGGIGYGALRYLSDDEDVRRRMSAVEQSPVLFNYLGRWRDSVAADSMFRFAKPVMASAPKNGPRPYQLEINASVFEGALRIDWTYSRNCHRDATIVCQAQQYRDELLRVIGICAASRDDRFSPADFPTADLSQNELDDILTEFGES